ncbi:VOC family protein [Catenulispora sp. NL8]|uniref:VOC family protein n=1 Tax=Catenulispora pinistramenti TaxID=2705254 RepID=A0ABS5KJP9_9ACTN|nr:VOC family protein [Catenulispora pinistramenti]
MNGPGIPAHAGIHHIKLPVADLERSAKWYSDVLGARRLTELDHHRPDGTLFAVILDIPGIAGRVELRLDPATAGALHGYDFLTLTVEDRPALDAWAAHLDALGITHSPPIVALAGWLLVVPDPDGLRLRFYTKQPHGLDESAVEFDSPWLGTGPLAPSPTEQQDTAICAVATLKALPGHADEVRDLMRSVAQATRRCHILRLRTAPPWYSASILTLIDPRAVSFPKDFLRFAWRLTASRIVQSGAAGRSPVGAGGSRRCGRSSSHTSGRMAPAGIRRAG